MFRILALPQVRQLLTTMPDNFRVSHKFFHIGNISGSDISLAKALRTPSSEICFFYFAAFASLRPSSGHALREILRFWLRRSRAGIFVSSVMTPSLFMYVALRRALSARFSTQRRHHFARKEVERQITGLTWNPRNREPADQVADTQFVSKPVDLVDAAFRIA